MTAAMPTDIRPPFTPETVLAKVQAAEDAWNSRDPERVARVQRGLLSSQPLSLEFDPVHDGDFDR